MVRGESIPVRSYVCLMEKAIVTKWWAKLGVMSFPKWAPTHLRFRNAQKHWVDGTLSNLLKICRCARKHSKLYPTDNLEVKQMFNLCTSLFKYYFFNKLKMRLEYTKKSWGVWKGREVLVKRNKMVTRRCCWLDFPETLYFWKQFFFISVVEH